MCESDNFLAPSVTARNGDQEGIPNVIIEALTCELPVLSTLHSGIPEVVREGVSGFLVPERNIEALSEKLEFLVNHPQTRKEMRAAGSAWVNKYHDIKKLSDRLVKLYESVLDDKIGSKEALPTLCLINGRGLPTECSAS